ncbi:MAG: hypothetical protein IPM47_12805 [Sphingobacteriales bacterium]|nr:MAG: hypothetical protein IPM47_12805 [Sphingobacteriales bacterium]
MNKIKFPLLFSLFLIAISAFFTACDKEQDDLVTENAATGGLVEPQNQSINYIVGDAKDYVGRVKVFQGEVKTTTLEVYKQFKGVLGTSNKALLTSIDIDENGGTSIISYTFNYNSLREGLTLSGGGTIPDDDQLLSIGDKWELTYTSVTSEGNRHTNSPSTAMTSVSVATRYAGVYEVIGSSYYRIGVPTATWDGATRIISSVDATTYFHSGFGPFTLNDNANSFFYFTIEEDQIDYLPEFNGVAITGLGSYLITCDTHPADMTNVPCGDGVSNYVQNDDVEGKDILYMSYGYFTTGSGPREFYEVLRKVVE